MIPLDKKYIVLLPGGRSVSEKLRLRHLQVCDDSSDSKSVNNLFIFSSLSNHVVDLMLVRDLKIRTTLRANQIAGFLTVPFQIKMTVILTRKLQLRHFLREVGCM